MIDLLLFDNKYNVIKSNDEKPSGDIISFKNDNSLMKFNTFFTILVSMVLYGRAFRRQ